MFKKYVIRYLAYADSDKNIQYWDELVSKRFFTFESVLDYIYKNNKIRIANGGSKSEYKIENESGSILYAHIKIEVM